MCQAPPSTPPRGQWICLSSCTLSTSEMTQLHLHLNSTSIHDMKLNLTKTKVMAFNFCKKYKFKPEITLQNEPIEHPLNTIQASLTWNPLKLLAAPFNLTWNTLTTFLKHLWNFPESSLKLSWNFLEIPLKLSVNLLKTSLKHNWNFLETQLKLQTPFKLSWNTIKTV